ncbi:MAG: Inner membrane symporter YihP [Firmicutes bacterium ADurb.Bin262]|nr:MAG: Inner membrane symporter YihP [Firmicutes bacterium ADurb.Bin262]
MADKKTNAAAIDAGVSDEEREQLKYVHQDRRYVGTKETVAYLLNDFSNSFNIGGFNNRFIWDVVKIDFRISAFIGIFTGAWDIINDSLIGMMVDKTRTRWGKFRPYLVGFQIPMTLIGSLYWLMPFFFPNTSATYLPKLIFYFTFNAFTETAGTFTSIARTGYMTTITPHPNDRARLIMLAELLTGYMGEDVPNMVMGVLLDLINNNIIGWKLRNVFLAMGMGTGIISSVFTLYFFLVSRERVMQTIERPSIRQGLKAVINNYPILLITLSNLLGGFSVGAGIQDYFIDVLGSASLLTLINFPSGFNGSISYAFVKPLRARFSTKALWVAEDLYTRFWWILVFIIGSVKQNYRKRLLMCFVIGGQAWFDKWAFGVRKVVNAELYNEAMDYCEWKNGYRMEATTSVARSLLLKIQGIFMGSVRNLLLDKIGYIQGLTIGTQADRTKWWLFAMSTGVPVLTGILAVIPKFVYPLSGHKRDRMYAELLARRQEIARDVNSADPEKLKELGQQELEGKFVRHDLFKD